MAIKDSQTQIITQALATPAPPVVVPPVAGIIGSLKLIEYSNPSAPTVAANVTGVVATPGGDECMWFDARHRAYTLSSTLAPNKLQITDCSSRTAPVVLSSINTALAGAGFNRMTVSGDGLGFFLIIARANIGASANVLEVFNVSDPTAPASVQSYNIASDFATSQANPSGAISRGNLLVVSSVENLFTDGKLGFYNLAALPVITQTTVTNLVPGATMDLAFDLVDVDVTATLAYVLVISDSLGIKELRIYDISTPALLVLLGSVALPQPGGAGTLVTILSNVDNGKIYGISSSSLNTDLYVIDVTNPLAPAVVSNTPVTTNSNFSVRGNDDTCFLARRANAGVPNNRTLTLFDTSNPLIPVEQGSVIYNAAGAASQLHLDVGFGV